MAEQAVMEAGYRLDWLHDEAKALQFGTMTMTAKIHRGRIVLVTITELLKQRSLEDVRQGNRAELIE